MCVMMDWEIKLVMIGKNDTHELRLTADDLVSCPFIIITSIGHVERTTRYTWKPF